MTVPDEAVEAAARAGWREAVNGNLRQPDDYARILLEAAAPFIAAQATVLIADLIDPEPCSFDHNHSCQAHGYFYIKQEEACPQHAAKEWVKTYRSGT